ncbi:response regulator [Xanthomonas maliensis]|uniref:response regulator n=1 Tax=Xanthomonas maliensis TaxID=1321368 RepID=UPI0003A36E31|nr:response regulator [Xanthomonas maliensis]KAB7772251.1 response regulator [Xanthomonas maliensis]
MNARVLIVEDESLVAMLLEDCLVELGYEIADTVATVAAAMSVVEAGGLDLALLDINLGGTPSFPVAEELERRGIPFIFVSGYARAGIPERYRCHHGLQKPFHFRDLQEAVGRLSQRCKPDAASAGEHCQ